MKEYVMKVDIDIYWFFYGGLLRIIKCYIFLCNVIEYNLR